MKLSTVNWIYWVAIAIFWVLFIVNVSDPGPTPKLQEVAMDLCVYVLLSAQFYVLGAKRADKSSAKNINIYLEKSK